MLLLPALAKGPVFTTNFDRVLETVYEAAQQPFKEHCWGARSGLFERALHENTHYLLKIHGDVLDRTDRVLTLGEYARHYGGTNTTDVDPSLPLPKLLEEAFATHPLLFLGYRLANDRTVRLLRRVRETRAIPPAHYAIVERPEDEVERVERARFLSDLNVRPLWYPVGQHEAVELFLEALLDAPAEERAPRSPAKAAHVDKEADLRLQQREEVRALGRNEDARRRLGEGNVLVGPGDLERKRGLSWVRLWIRHNKQWLFSGIGVFFLGGLLTLGGWLYQPSNRGGARDGGSHPLVPAPGSAVVLTTTVPSPTSLATPTKAFPTKPPVAIFDFVVEGRLACAAPESGTAEESSTGAPSESAYLEGEAGYEELRPLQPVRIFKAGTVATLENRFGLSDSSPLRGRPTQFLLGFASLHLPIVPSPSWQCLSMQSYEVTVKLNGKDFWSKRQFIGKRPWEGGGSFKVPLKDLHARIGGP